MEDVELEGSQPVTGPAPGADHAAESPRGGYRLDLDSDELPSYLDRDPATERPAPAAPRLPAAVEAPAADPMAEIRELARQGNERASMALAAITPYLQGLQRQASGQQKQPPSLEQILHDPNVTTEHLIEYVEGMLQQRLTHAEQRQELAARRGSSDQFARGLFTGDGYQGREFDTMRTKYIAPVLERIPYLRDVITALNPEQPALIEYGLAALMEISARSKDDPAQFYRNLWALLDNQAGADVGRKIQQGARHQAARIASAHSTAGRPRRGNGGLTARDIEEMPDAEFDRLDAELTGGL